MLEGLIFDCPFGSEECSCPFAEIRKLPVKERIAYLSKIDDKEAGRLLMEHSTCLQGRETK